MPGISCPRTKTAVANPSPAIATTFTQYFRIATLLFRLTQACPSCTKHRCSLPARSRRIYPPFFYALRVVVLSSCFFTLPNPLHHFCVLLFRQHPNHGHHSHHSCAPILR